MKSFFKVKTNIILLSVIFVLIAALVFSVTVIVDRNNKIADVNAQISQNRSVIEEKTKKLEELEKALQENSANNSQTEEQIKNYEAEKQKLLEEKEKLLEENKQLKSQIAQLAAEKRKAEAKAAINAANALQTNKPDGKVCYLTFDDGPSDNTLKILDTLKEYNVKATFFVIKSANLDYIKRAYAEGHAIGLHTATHRYEQLYASEEAYFNDLAEISNAVNSLIGVEPKIMRFPGGSSNGVSRKYCDGLMTKLVRRVGEEGYSYFDWNVSSGDASGNNVSVATIVNNIKKQSKGKNSVCVLMHDNLAKRTTAAALPQIIEYLALEGYRFETFKAGDFGYHHGSLNN